MRKSVEAFQQAKSFMNPPTFYSSFPASDKSESQRGPAWQMSDLRHLHLPLETRRPGTERGRSCERGSRVANHFAALSPCTPAQNCLGSWSSEAQSTASTWERAAAAAGTRPGLALGALALRPYGHPKQCARLWHMRGHKNGDGSPKASKVPQRPSRLSEVKGGLWRAYATPKPGTKAHDPLLDVWFCFESLEQG